MTGILIRRGPCEDAETQGECHVTSEALDGVMPPQPGSIRAQKRRGSILS